MTPRKILPIVGICVFSEGAPKNPREFTVACHLVPRDDHRFGAWGKIEGERFVAPLFELEHPLGFVTPAASLFQSLNGCQQATR